MTTSGWRDYVDSILDRYGWTIPRAVEETGIDKSAFSRWKTQPPSTAHVVRFARATDTGVLSALVAAGIITAEEANQRELPVLASSLGTWELMRELERRVAKIDGPSVQRSLNRPPSGPAAAVSSAGHLELVEDDRAAAFDPGHLPEDEPEVFD